MVSKQRISEDVPGLDYPLLHLPTDYTDKKAFLCWWVTVLTHKVHPVNTCPFQKLPFSQSCGFSICGFEQSKQSSLPGFQATRHTKTSCQNSAISVELASTSLNFTEGGTFSLFFFFFFSQTIDHIPVSALGQNIPS